MTLMHLVTVSAFCKRGKCFSVLYSAMLHCQCTGFLSQSRIRKFRNMIHSHMMMMMTDNSKLSQDTDHLLTDSSYFVKHPYFTRTMT